MERRMLVAAFLVVAALGCGKGKGDLAGTASFEGKKLAMGTVWVIGADGLPYYGQIGDDGSYRIKDIPSGRAKIAVYCPNPVVKGREGGGKEDDPRAKSREPAPKVDGKKWFAIPDRYAQHDSSDLSTTIQTGENKHDILLKK